MKTLYVAVVSGLVVIYTFDALKSWVIFGASILSKKLARQGVKDMVRISDGRMSGTAAGTIILHVAPEAAIGGPLALVQTGDRICLDAAGRRLELLVSDEEMARRKSALQLPKMSPNRGYGKLFHDHVVQAPGGVDFDFLQDVDTAETSGDA